jgi:hypothetical protein
MPVEGPGCGSGGGGTTAGESSLERVGHRGSRRGRPCLEFRPAAATFRDERTDGAEGISEWILSSFL